MLSEIKEHFKKHKEKYIFGVVGITVGVFAVKTTTKMRESHAEPDAGSDCPARESVGSFNFSKSFFGNATTNVLTTHTGSRGNPGFLTRCIDTNETFATQGSAARAFGIPEDIMSRRLNHGRALDEGVSFERVSVLGEND